MSGSHRACNSVFAAGHVSLLRVLAASQQCGQPMHPRHAVLSRPVPTRLKAAQRQRTRFVPDVDWRIIKKILGLRLNRGVLNYDELKLINTRGTRGCCNTTWM